MSTPTFNRKEMEHILKKSGWVLCRISGSHKIYKNDKGEHLTLAICRCNKMIFQRLIKEHNLLV